MEERTGVDRRPVAGVPLFSELSGEELEGISRVAVPRSYPKGVRVFHEGDHSDACYIVRSGDLRVTREHPDGRAIALATLGPGDIFGELAMLDGEARSASVEALTDASSSRCPRPTCDGCSGSSSEITVKLVFALTRRLREANERIARQSFQTVPSRVAGVLSQLIAEEAPLRGPRGGDDPDDARRTSRSSPGPRARASAGSSRCSSAPGSSSVGRGRVTVLEPRRLRGYIF